MLSAEQKKDLMRLFEDARRTPEPRFEMKYRRPDEPLTEIEYEPRFFGLFSRPTQKEIQPAERSIEKYTHKEAAAFYTRDEYHRYHLTELGRQEAMKDPDFYWKLPALSREKENYVFQKGIATEVAFINPALLKYDAVDMNVSAFDKIDILLGPPPADLTPECLAKREETVANLIKEGALGNVWARETRDAGGLARYMLNHCIQPNGDIHVPKEVASWLVRCEKGIQEARPGYFTAFAQFPKGYYSHDEPEFRSIDKTLKGTVYAFEDDIRKVCRGDKQNYDEVFLLCDVTQALYPDRDIATIEKQQWVENIGLGPLPAEIEERLTSLGYDMQRAKQIQELSDRIVQTLNESKFGFIHKCGEGRTLGISPPETPQISFSRDLSSMTIRVGSGTWSEGHQLVSCSFDVSLNNDARNTSGTLTDILRLPKEQFNYWLFEEMQRSKELSIKEAELITEAPIETAPLETDIHENLTNSRHLSGDSLMPNHLDFVPPGQKLEHLQAGDVPAYKLEVTFETRAEREERNERIEWAARNVI